jgi:hypothetical protein
MWFLLFNPLCMFGLSKLQKSPLLSNAIAMGTETSVYAGTAAAGADCMAARLESHWFE